jgi:hypothetical protein
MKLIVNQLPTYNNSIDAITAAATLRRKVTTSAGTYAVTLPSAKDARKEFTVISTSGTATFTPVSPDTLTGLATVAVNTSGTVRAVGSNWYRVA